MTIRDTLLRLLKYRSKLDQKIFGRRSFMKKEGMIEIKWSAEEPDQSLIERIWIGISGISLRRDMRDRERGVIKGLCPCSAVA